MSDPLMDGAHSQTFHLNQPELRRDHQIAILHAHHNLKTQNASYRNIP